MSKTRITVDLNTLLLEQLRDFAKRHQMTVDFVLGVAVDQFLSDPDNHLEPLRCAS